MRRADTDSEKFLSARARHLSCKGGNSVKKGFSDLNVHQKTQIAGSFPGPGLLIHWTWGSI